MIIPYCHSDAGVRVGHCVPHTAENKISSDEKLPNLVLTHMYSYVLFVHCAKHHRLAYTPISLKHFLFPIHRHTAAVPTHFHNHRILLLVHQSP